MKENLAIFDLDGTLFDTDYINYKAYEQALSEHGYSISLDYYARECNGRRYSDFLPPIIGKDKDMMETIHNKKLAAYPLYMHMAKPNIHLWNMIEALRGNYHLAIVTTASRKNCLELLDCFQRAAMFDLIVSQEDVIAAKPNPEGFIKAMAHFEIGAKNTVIFEDSETGIKAAMETGASVFMIRRFSVYE